MNNTKKRLVASLLAMAMCFTMLVGSTFAWFTDTAKTNVNTIQSGKLEVDLVDGTGATLVGKTLEFKKAAGGEGEAVLWEPGAKYALEDVFVKNLGTLALKYRVVITGINGDAMLNDVIDWTIKIGDTEVAADTEFHLKSNETSPKLEIIGKMQETAGNDYQDKTIAGVSIEILATQDTVEYDSFNNTYDSQATYPDGEKGDTTLGVGSLEDLKAAIELAVNDTANSGVITINLEKDFDATGEWEAITPKGYSGVNEVVINGNGHKISNLNAPLIVGSFAGSGSITINDLTIEGANINSGKYNNLGLGAVVAYSDSSGGVNFNNVKVINSKVECTDGYAGALIGYSSTPVIIKGGEVSNNTIIGGNSTGGVAGQFAATATVENITVTGNTIKYANGDEVNTDGWRVGIVVGTANAGTVTMANITESNNTLSQGTVVAPDHSNLYGRSLGNGITLDGTAI